jgi:hypothetical protein
VTSWPRTPPPWRRPCEPCTAAGPTWPSRCWTARRSGPTPPGRPRRWPRARRAGGRGAGGPPGGAPPGGVHGGRPGPRGARRCRPPVGPPGPGTLGNLHGCRARRSPRSTSTSWPGAATRARPVLDVREDDEYASGHVPGATHIPLGQVPDRIAEVPTDRTVYVVCRSGGAAPRPSRCCGRPGSTPSTSPAARWRGWTPGSPSPTAASPGEPARGLERHRAPLDRPIGGPRGAPRGARRRARLRPRHRVPPRAHLLRQAGPPAAGPGPAASRSSTPWRSTWRRWPASSTAPAPASCTPRPRTSRSCCGCAGPCPGDLFDTQVAAGFAGYSGVGLAALVSAELGVSLPKGDRLTDWLARPLPADAATYAANDVVHLLELHRRLVAELEASGRLQWARDECAPPAGALRPAARPHHRVVADQGGPVAARPLGRGRPVPRRLAGGQGP